MHSTNTALNKNPGRRLSPTSKPAWTDWARDEDEDKDGYQNTGEVCVMLVPTLQQMNFPYFPAYHDLRNLQPMIAYPADAMGTVLFSFGLLTNASTLLALLTLLKLLDRRGGLLPLSPFFGGSHAAGTWAGRCPVRCLEKAPCNGKSSNNSKITSIVSSRKPRENDGKLSASRDPDHHHDQQAFHFGAPYRHVNWDEADPQIAGNGSELLTKAHTLFLHYNL
ncbi:hypothetical protein BKA64DRAFT_635204 [Cadophora sp. MPI-SDFR-AT-0126]|nr:hypothetical protein BKA64DRAFT_635204 [Leotiomycetes sp. MPI-SDFR-AT-0126]